MSYQQFGHVDRDERIELAADEPIGEPARWNLLPRPLLNVLVMAGFAGALYFAYVQGTHHPTSTPPAAPAAATQQQQQQPPATPAVVAQNPPPPAADNLPLIKADPQPMKVKPDQPGGLVVPDRNMAIYTERQGGPPVEKLLPPPEQPEARPVAPPPAPAAPPQVAMAPAAPAPAPMHIAPPAPIAPQRPAPSAGADKGGHIRILLASLRTPDEARSEWQRLKKAQPELLGKMTADAVRADLGDRGTWYKIEAGSFARAATAERVCRQLKERHLGCSVVK
ncbi:MAG TPA: SPOR domain-containing protein [Stellaceae bacterium]|jgi:hypothetical protein|nr:SPOR domain-containing protein [Stellaceae bacterium]